MSCLLNNGLIYSKATFRLLFEKIDKTDIDTFRTLAGVCKKSREVAIEISNKTYNAYLNKRDISMFWIWFGYGCNGDKKRPRGVYCL